MAKSDTQTSLRLPEELRERLATAATANGRGIGEEMRQRLERSLQTAPTDNAQTPQTRQLLAAIADVATDMMLDGTWHDDLHLFQVFKEALLALLARFEPSGPSPDAHYLWSKPEDPPEVVGRMYAGFAWRNLDDKE